MYVAASAACAWAAKLMPVPLWHTCRIHEYMLKMFGHGVRGSAKMMLAVCCSSPQGKQASMKGTPAAGL
jgi:hypothetical protein